MAHAPTKIDALTRRGLLGAAAAAGAQLALGSDRMRLVDAAAATCPGPASLTDIEHVVILIQENRSFDHYYGTLAAVRGFDDRAAGGLGAFAQRYPANTTRAPIGRLLPFRFDTSSSDADCTNDIDHAWTTQHQSWNGGRMDAFVAAHEAADGAAYGTATMGYYTRADLPFHYALADAFTVCDRWHCSLMGPTYPNRLYSVSATIDPDGRAGGPVVTNPSAGPGSASGIYSWETMPERLQQAGIPWKVYSQAATNNNVLALFKGYTDPASALFANGVRPTWPADFDADCAAGTLPAVSWVLAPMDFDEHPPNPPQFGEWVIAQVLSALVANPAVWERTVLFVTYDENGGFFDHVAPPTAPPGTPGEWLTVSPLPSDAGGIAGPIGLGMRVPGLVVSPFSRGGLLCSDAFDHTSLLRFLETRFGVAVPNLSTWRRAVTGDLTSALDLASAPNASAPDLASPSLADPTVLRECGPAILQGTVANAPPYPLPATQAMPVQERGAKRNPSGLLCAGASAGAPAAAADVLRISVRGVVRRLSRGGFRARVEVVHSSPLVAVSVRLNGRRIVRTQRASFGFAVHARALRRGRNELTVTAEDALGRRARHSVAVEHGGR